MCVCVCVCVMIENDLTVLGHSQFLTYVPGKWSWYYAYIILTYKYSLSQILSTFFINISNYISN